VRFSGYVAPFGAAKLESDIDILLVAIPWRFFLSDFYEVVKHILGTICINAAHMQETNVPPVEIIFNVLAGAPDLEDCGIRAQLG